MELGNLLFNKGNNNQQYECPEYIIALLNYLDDEIQRVMWNITQKEFDSPFSNTANSFKTNKFEVKAFNWNEDYAQPYNFIYYVDKTKSNLDDVKISWYKYLDRDTTINQELDSSVVIDIFNECLESIRELEPDYYKYSK